MGMMTERKGMAGEEREKKEKRGEESLPDL